jgi:hypothetical protein
MKVRTLYLSLALSLPAYHLAVSADYISGFSSFPAYPYNTSSYKQSGAFVGCGPTTGAMILSYFQTVHSLTGLLTNPGTGVDKGLNTAWALHGASYMKTEATGFGDVYNIKSGLEGYAKSKGYTIKVLIHVSSTYTDPNNASWGAYGSYGDAWTNDGSFWKQNSGNTWSIDSDKFCDFLATELSQGIPVFLTIDTKAAGTGDHWVPLVGYDKSAKKYAYYDTYDTSVHWADIYYSGDPAGKKVNSIVMVRTVAFTAGGGGSGTIVFTGHAYRGNKPDATNPTSGVTVELYGDTDEWPTSGKKILLSSTTTNASGEFTLTLASGSTTSNYYHVEETDPTGVYSVNAQAPSPGYVKNYNCVSFKGSALTPGTTYSNIAFWDVSSSGGGGGGTGSGQLTVINTSGFDTGSLGAAIAYANTHPGIDTIRFNIPKSDPGFNTATGVWTIAPNNSFQGITEAGVVINGFSQRDFIGEDANPQGPEIQVIGTNAGTNIDGLYIASSHAEISGLTVCGYRVGIAMIGVNSGRISGCYLGTNAKGDKATANKYGIWLGHRTQNILIVPAEGQPNVISGNTEAGICISDTSFHNTVRGNIIGMNRAESAAIPNGTFGGVLIQNDSYENEVADNHISGNNHGVFLYQKAHHNMVADNWIGTDPSWNLDLGNTLNGVSIDEGASDNQIRQNFIGRNHGFGIRVNGSNSVRNKLTHNAISLNTQAGIRNDDGGNMNLQAPVIANSSPSEVSGTAVPNAVVEIYTDQGNQGAMFQGETTADGSGHFSWNGSIGGPFTNVTAIAMDPSGNTSPFSQSAVVTAVERMGETDRPATFSLSQNYPNPFNPATTIAYAVPRSGRVYMAIYDVQGRRVKTLVDGIQPVGRFKTSWNGMDEMGSPLSAGVYCCRLETDGFVRVIKLSLFK